MDWNNMQTWHYFAIASGIVLVLGVILYFVPVGKRKLPWVITAAFGGVGVGLALGILFMAGFGYHPEFTDRPPQPGRGTAVPAPVTAPDSTSAKTQLLDLITALDRVTDRSVTITLSSDQRRAMADQLKGLESTPEISEEEARKRLEAILKIVENDRETLKAAGYPARADHVTSQGGKPASTTNPFKDGPFAERFRSFRERLTKK